MLTQKQEDFCLNIVSGMSATDASLQAGYADPNHTSLMLKTVKISERITELRKPAVDSTKMLVQEREERLSDIAREELSSAKGTPLRGPNISAIQELNKMDGSYAPEKHAVLGAIIIEVVYKETKLIGEDNATE
ncbi:hypothetical protein LCGC14_2543820 [marine sediment metagenome]|uniref:Terminase small subunit n=1 Tax=marine sediment metagenome TaxID=412755 RepID=A0A0F9D1G2_9ZZZZ